MFLNSGNDELSNDVPKSKHQLPPREESDPKVCEILTNKYIYIHAYLSLGHLRKDYKKVTHTTCNNANTKKQQTTTHKTQHNTTQHKARHYTARQDKTWQDNTRQYKTRPDTTTQDNPRQHNTTRCDTRQRKTSQHTR